MAIINLVVAMADIIVLKLPNRVLILLAIISRPLDPRSIVLRQLIQAIIQQSKLLKINLILMVYRIDVLLSTGVPQYPSSYAPSSTQYYMNNSTYVPETSAHVHTHSHTHGSGAHASNYYYYQQQQQAHPQTHHIPPPQHQQQQNSSMGTQTLVYYDPVTGQYFFKKEI